MAECVDLIAGPARSGKTDRLLEAYRKWLADRPGLGRGDAALWISPTMRVAANLRDQLAAAVDQAVLAPGITTFAGFAESVVVAGRRPVRAVSRLQQRRLLQLVVDRLLQQRQLKYCHPVARSAGFLDEVGQVIAEFKRQDIWAEDFAARSLGRRDRDLSKIYSAYQRQLVVGDLYDAEGLFWAARDSLAATPRQWGLIVVDGFSDFTAAQYDILGLLSQQCRQLTISLTTEPDDVEPGGRTLLFTKPRETLARLQQSLPGLRIDWQGDRPLPRAGLDHLRCQLFRDVSVRDGAAAPTDGLQIVAANGAQGEVEEVARRVKRLLTDDQVPPGDVLVVFRHLDQVADRVAQVFDDFGIPHACESRPRLRSAPHVRGLRALLRLHVEDWPFRRLLEVVGNRIFSTFDEIDGEIDGEGDPRIALQRSLRAAQLPKGKKQVLDQLRRAASSVPLSSGEDAVAPQQLAHVALGRLQRLAESLDRLPVQAPLGDWIDRLEALLVELGTLSANNAAWAALRRGLRSIELAECWALGAGQPLTVPQLLEAIEMVAADARLPASHDAIGRVQVLGAESARHLSAPHLFLAGLAEQAFAEPEARRWSAPEGAEAPPGGPAVGTLLLFYELATRATESLTLSYAALDDKGQTLPPSPLLTEVERCFGATPLPKTTMPLGDPTSSQLDPASRSAFRQAAVSNAIAGQPRWLAGMISEPRSARGGNSILGGIECVARRGEREAFGAYEGMLLSPTAQAALASRFDATHLWSPSQLETYAACPFRFFAEQLLTLEPPEELTLRSDAARRGSLLHQVLATLHTQLAQVAGDSSDPEDLVARFRNALTEAVAATPLAGLAQALREIERREIEAWAPRYAQQEHEYRGQWDHLDQPLRPAYFELRFGPEIRETASVADGSTPVPFELDLGDQQILLTGQIDRIDLGRVGDVTVFNIIDYKSGQEVKFKVEQVQSGRQLQLPLYALAVEQHVLANESPQGHPQGLSAGYWNIKAQGFKSGRSGPLELREVKDQSLRATDQWNELQRDLLTRVGQLVDGIRSGHFPVYNDDQDCTRSCAFRTVCRIAQVRSLEKEWDGETTND